MAMNFTTLTGLKSVTGSIKYFVNHNEVPAEEILTSAQGLIYSYLRTREMIVRAVGTIATGATTLAIPAACREPMALYRGGSYKGKIRLIDQEHFAARTGEDENGDVYAGTPTEATYDASLFYLNAEADQDYPYRLWYMGTPAALSVSNETNFLTTKFPHLLEAACKHYAFHHRGESDDARHWLEIAMGAIGKANDEYDLFRQSIQAEMYWSQ